MFAETPIEVGMLTPGVVRSIVREAQNAIGRETRKLNKTGATKRTGKHHKLDPDAKAAREAARRVRKAKREEAKETIAEAAKIRWARRRAEEDERAARRRLRIHVPKEKEPKVTAGGGRKYARSYQRFERQVLPMLPARMPAGSTALVFRIKSRRLGGLGKSRWRKNELANFLRYLTRQQSLAAEPEAAVFTNISQHEPGTDAFARELAAFGQVVENLEAAIDPNGQVYHSGVIPLPWEIGSEAHCRIARTLEQAFAWRGLPCIVVVHAPDPGSDWRNVHLHFAVVTRAFIRHGERDWSFAPTRSRDVFHPAMVTAWRRYLVGMFNRELGRTMSERRYTHEVDDPSAEHLGRVRTAEGRPALVEAQARHKIAVSEEVDCLTVKEVADNLVQSATRVRAAGGEIVRLALAFKMVALRRQADRLAGFIEQSGAIRVVVGRALRRNTIEKLRTDLLQDRERLGKAHRELSVWSKFTRLVGLQQSLQAQGDRAAALAERCSEIRQKHRAVRTLASSRDAMRALQSRLSAGSSRLTVLASRNIRDRRLHDLKARLAPRHGSVAATSQRMERLRSYVNAYPGLAHTRDRVGAHRQRLDLVVEQLADVATLSRAARARERPGSAVAEPAVPDDVLRSFDKAAAAFTSSCSEAFEGLLAFARLAILKRRLVIRRSEDAIELAAADEATLVGVRDLAARPWGRQVLRQAAQPGETPADWRRALFPAVAKVDWSDERLLRLARQAALSRSSAANREGVIHGRIDRAVQAGLLDSSPAASMKAAAGRNGLFFTLNLQTETGGARLMLAAADRGVLSILEGLLKNPKGIALLTLLARKDALGDYPAPGDWAAHIVRLKTLTKARDGAGAESDQWADKTLERLPKGDQRRKPEPHEQETKETDASAEPDTPEELGLDALGAAYAAKVNQR
ncbi:MAG: hypothetical protein ACK4SZ_06820 [Allosphingosinicella sp.]|uniref:hypothetical protein n=1 Tax=Allosphingosinicella sp. TaxID=2823234 RepID=UPI0039303047